MLSMMQVSIIPYRIIDQKIPAGFYREEDYVISEDVPEFDCLRHVGDNDFVLNVHFAPHLTVEKDADQRYYRPVDFEQAFNWVLDTDTIFSEDKPRLLDLLNAMDEDRQLHLYFSF